MAKRTFFIISALFVLSSLSVAYAQGYYTPDLGQRVPQAGRSNERKTDFRTEYVFAVSFSFADSVFYMSEVQKLDSMVVTANYYVNENDEYQRQFKSWLEKGGAPLQVASLYCFPSRSKAVSRFKKVQVRVARKHKSTVVTVPDFKFHTPSGSSNQ